MIIRSGLVGSLIALVFCSSVQAQSPDAEVHILAYDILAADDYIRFSNAHYAFEICICNRPSRDPKLSRFCTCADVKAGTVRDGPFDKQDTCLTDKSSYECLNAALPYFDREAPIYYIRISANGIVLTRPGWQELTQGDDKTTRVSMPAIVGDISMTFSITEHLQKWNNRPAAHDTQTTTTRSPVLKERKARPWFLMTTTEAPFWTRMRTTSRPPTTTSTTTTVAPWVRHDEWQDNEVDAPSASSDNDYTRFTGISNMWELRNFLYMESLKDRVAPYNLDIQEFKDEVIAYHNALRAVHGAPPLEYDPYLENEGQRWANYLGARQSCTMHDPNRRYGECLFYFGGHILPSAKSLAGLTAQSFYLERNSYDYNNYRPVFFYKTGHFTQMVWRNSRKIGVGVYIGLASGGGAPCRPWQPTYQLYVVVKYDPPGNVQSSNAYKNNVFPPLY